MIENKTRAALKAFSEIANELEDKWNDISPAAQNQLDELFTDGGISMNVRSILSTVDDLLSDDMAMKTVVSDANTLNYRAFGDENYQLIAAREAQVSEALAADPVDLDTLTPYLKDGAFTEKMYDYAFETDDAILAKAIMTHCPGEYPLDFQRLAEKEAPATTVSSKPGF